MHKRGLLVLLVVILLVLSFPAAAQDDEHPLLTLLQYVPDNAAMIEGNPTVGYVDFRAMDAAETAAAEVATRLNRASVLSRRG